MVVGIILSVLSVALAGWALIDGRNTRREAKSERQEILSAVETLRDKLAVGLQEEPPEDEAQSDRFKRELVVNIDTSFPIPPSGVIMPTGIPSAEAFGTPTLHQAEPQ